MSLVIECKRLVESDLIVLDALAKLFPHWKKNSIQRKVKETIGGKDYRFVALNEGKIIGHLKVTFGKGIHKHRAEMSSLVVDKQYRHHGVGTKLVEFVLKSMPKGISLVLLATDVKNKNAINLYKKLGFKKYGQLPKASLVNGKFVNNYLMRKEL